MAVRYTSSCWCPLWDWPGGARCAFERCHVVAFSLAGAQYRVSVGGSVHPRLATVSRCSYYWSSRIRRSRRHCPVRRSADPGPDRLVPLVTAGIAWVRVPADRRPGRGPTTGRRWFLFVALVAVAGAVAVCRRSTVAAATVVVVLVGWTQIGAPAYDPSAYALLQLGSCLRPAVPKAGDTSEVAYREAVWFEEQMDTITNDASTSFVALGPWRRRSSGCTCHTWSHTWCQWTRRQGG